MRACSVRASGALDGKGDDFVQAIRAGGDHHDAIEAQRDARAGRQSRIERGEEGAVRVASRLAAGEPRGGIGGEAPLLLGRVAEFVETVGKFQPAPEGLESCRDRTGDPGKRRLRRREVAYESDA